LSRSPYRRTTVRST